MFDIKPLKWVDTPYGDSAHASTLIGIVAVAVPVGGGPGTWSYCFVRDGGTGEEACSDLADGKAKAEAAYKERLSQALETVVPPAKKVAGVRVLVPGTLPAPKPLTGTCRHCGCKVEADSDARAIGTRQVEQAGWGADSTSVTVTIREVRCPTFGCAQHIELHD